MPSPERLGEGVAAVASGLRAWSHILFRGVEFSSVAVTKCNPGLGYMMGCVSYGRIRTDSKNPDHHMGIFHIKLQVIGSQWWSLVAACGVE